MSIRRLALAAACVGLSAALAGCGGSGGAAGAQPAATPVQTATPKPSAAAKPAKPSPAKITPTTKTYPKKALLPKAKAEKVAQAAVLAPKDMPGYKAEALAGDRTRESKRDSCLGLKAPAYLVRNFGVAYANGTLTIDSNADVAPSVAAATKEIKVYQSTKGPACYEQLLRADLADASLTPTEVKVSKAAVHVAGADDAFAYRVEIKATGPSGPLTLTGWQVGSRVGPVTLGVTTLEMNTSTLTLQQVETLAGIAAVRAKAAL